MARKRAARPRPRDESPTPDPERERVPILGSLRGEVMVFQPMTILDISRGGAQIETAFPLQLDSLHDFRLTLNDQSVVVKGRIAHCHIGDLEEERVGYRTGVEFIEPPEHVRHAVMEFIETLKAQRKR
jgi:PilZ domain